MALRTGRHIVTLALVTAALWMSPPRLRADAAPAADTSAARAERLARAQTLLDRLRGAPADASESLESRARDLAELNALASQRARRKNRGAERVRVRLAVV